jgi:hypothetical protein
VEAVDGRRFVNANGIWMRPARSQNFACVRCRGDEGWRYALKTRSAHSVRRMTSSAVSPP